MGLGHVTRSIALAQTFEEMHADVGAFFCNEDPAVRARFLSAGIPADRVHVVGNSHLREAVNCVGADFLLVDQPTDVTDTVRAIRQDRTGLVLAALDPPVLDPEAFDVIVNLFHHGASPRPPAGRARYFEGLEYAILRQEFLESHRPCLRERGSALFVSFGGTDPQRLTLEVLRAIRDDPTHGMTAHVVIGPGFTFKEEIQAAAASAVAKITLHHSPNDMGRLMARCDLGVVGAGTTVMEMCCVGCPAIVIAQNELEVRFAHYLDGRGVAHYLGPAGEVSEEKIRAALWKLTTDYVLRGQLAEQGKTLIDGNGRRRTAELLLREFARRRKVA
jgi:UDP-2,4-diacetamido-2,4,6-trideoxy-beta-L-altropyranose hydrolase